MGTAKIDEGANLDQIINRQMARWEARRKASRAGGDAARKGLAQLKEGPWITVSRQTGADGEGLAEKLAEELGWQAFDHEILSAIARHDPAREKLLSRLDERAVGALQDFLSTVLDQKAVSRAAYAHEVAQVVWTLARKGHAVLVGRGANFILDSRYGLRVRVVAPRALRILRVSQKRGIDAALAEQAMQREDEDHAAFIRQTYHQEIEDPLGYDLILNLGALDLDAAADAVVSALRRKLDAPAASALPPGETMP